MRNPTVSGRVGAGAVERLRTSAAQPKPNIWPQNRRFQPPQILLFCLFAKSMHPQGELVYEAVACRSCAVAPRRRRDVF